MKNVRINENQLRKLLASADMRIEVAEKTREEAVRKAEKEAAEARAKVERHTKAIARKIVSLVHDVLTTIDAEKGSISPELVLERGLGKVTNLRDSATRYELDGRELKIVLDYSTEYMDFTSYGDGVSFIKKYKYSSNKEGYVDSKNNEIDYAYLIEILAEKGIEFEYFESDTEVQEGARCVKFQSACIRFSREKKKPDDKEPYTKK